MTDDVNFKHGPQAAVLLDSVSPEGDRLTTLEVVIHRFIQAEMLTHRTHSRNSASSRAIPFRKQVERVKQYPAVPVSFPAEQRGMSGGDEVESRAGAESRWLTARNAAVRHAEELAALGVHKSVVNRLLEPFMWSTLIMSATEFGWHNLFEQRCHPDAQPEFRIAAEAMRDAYNDSTPQQVDFGQWHMPLIDAEDHDTAAAYLRDDNAQFVSSGGVTELLKQVSVARCARVSYLTHDGQRSIDKDLELYNRLMSADPPHWSPTEHIATPATYSEQRAGEVMGNLGSWHQLRHFVPQQR